MENISDLIEKNESEIEEVGWRSNSSIFILVKNIEMLIETIGKYRKRIEWINNAYRDADALPEPERGTYLNNVSYVSMLKSQADGAPPIKLNFDIRAMIDTSILMTCVSLEADINKFCFYSLGEECCGAIEKLSMSEKMIVCHSFITENNSAFKSLHAYESINGLVQWRNKYAHGKLPEVKKKDIKGNHLSEPNRSIKLYDHIQRFLKYLNYYTKAIDYMSKNDISGEFYIVGQNEDIRKMVEYIQNMDLKAIKDDVI